VGATGLAVQEWGDSSRLGILLCPGLGNTGAYFALLAPALPGRAVAVDLPGCGRSGPLEPRTSDRLVELAREVFERYGCAAVVGHSLGAYVAVGLAADPPPGLRAAVLIDGGYLDRNAYSELGMPVTEGWAQLAAWMRSNQSSFADWDSAIRTVAPFIGGEGTSALEAYVRDFFTEVDGEIRGRMQPERMADLLLAVLDQDVLARAGGVRVPTLLIACGRPEERRAPREAAWTRFAQASELIELNVAADWGHNPTVQDLEGASRLIADWLRARI
jgi:pimeloyl-ACP methyl ester carboxylesterase